MKIAYLIDTTIPSLRANTVHVMHMCQALQAEGQDVTLYCDGVDNDNEYDIMRKYGITIPFKIERVHLSKFARKIGHRFAIMILARKKAKRVKGVDYVYGRSAYAINGIKHKYKYIFEVHAEPDKWNFMFEKKVINHKNCIGVVTISNNLKRRYIEMFPNISTSKFIVLHDCADIDKSEIDSKASLAPQEGYSKVVIGYLGHLYPGKCMETLIPLAKSRPSYLFHVVGGEEQWIHHWKKECEYHNVQNIVFYGFVDNSKVGDYYRSFDICILPFSKSVLVGSNKNLDIGNWISPLKLFEAMSYKKAILVSRLPSIEEVIEDAVDGVFAKPDDIDDWGRKLDSIVFNQDYRIELGNNAFKKLTNDYTWKKRAKRIIRVMEEDYNESTNK